MPAGIGKYHPAFFSYIFEVTIIRRIQAADGDTPALRQQQAVQMPGNRGLPAFLRPDKSKCFARINRKRNIANRLPFTCAITEVIYLDNAQTDCLLKLLNDNIYYFSLLGNTL